MSAQLLVYRFDAGAEFEGQLVGALERIEAKASKQVLDVIFVARDPASGELIAFDLKASRGRGMVVALIGIRLDPGERARVTKRAVTGARKDLIASLSETIKTGDALVAILVGHEWAGALVDAVQRTGGRAVADAAVEATSLDAVTEQLLASAGAG